MAGMSAVSHGRSATAPSESGGSGGSTTGSNYPAAFRGVRLGHGRGGKRDDVPELERLRRYRAGDERGGAPIAIAELPGHMDLAVHGLHPEGRVTRNPS